MPRKSRAEEPHDGSMPMRTRFRELLESLRRNSWIWPFSTSRIFSVRDAVSPGESTAPYRMLPVGATQRSGRAATSASPTDQRLHDSSSGVRSRTATRSADGLVRSNGPRAPTVGHDGRDEQSAHGVADQTSWRSLPRPGSMAPTRARRPYEDPTSRTRSTERDPRQAVRRENWMMSALRERSTGRRHSLSHAPLRGLTGSGAAGARRRPPRPGGPPGLTGNRGVGGPGPGGSRSTSK